MKFVVFSAEKLIAWVCILALICLCFLYFLSFYQSYVPDPSKYEIKNNDKERRKFIRSFGVELMENKCSVSSMNIPIKFDKNMKKYNEIQKEMGLSLNHLRGKTVKKYTYKCKIKGKIYQTNLLMYGNYVVGADITDMKDKKNIQSLYQNFMCTLL